MDKCEWELIENFELPTEVDYYVTDCRHIFRKFNIS